MHDDPKALFLEGALPAFDAYVASVQGTIAGRNKDLRLAKDAALALFHLREHLPWTRGKPWPVELEACADYALLEDIVNVFKHGGPRREGAVAVATDVYELTLVTEYQDALGPYRDTSRIVEVKLKDGSVRNLEDVLRTVLNMWIASFQTQGLLSEMSARSPRVHQVPSRRNALGSARLDYELTQGVGSTMSIRRQRYNHATGQVEGVDMTDHGYVLNIGKPVEATIRLTHNATGERIEQAVQLSIDEQVMYEALKTTDKRDEYLRSLAPKYARQVLESTKKRQP